MRLGSRYGLCLLLLGVSCGTNDRPTGAPSTSTSGSSGGSTGDGMASTGTIDTVSSGGSGASASAGSGSAAASGVGFGGTGAASGDSADAGDAGESAQDGAADGGGPQPPLKVPFDWVGILGTGQSLAVGGGPAINMSTTQPFKNIKLADNRADPKYPIDNTGSPQWAVVPPV